MSYIIEKNTDIFGNDYGFYPNKTIKELKEICNSIQDAIGFNSLGYIKRYTSTFTSLDKCDLYINKSRQEQVIKNKKKMACGDIKEDITFVITTCKRFDMFVKSMNMFLYNCEDLHVIKQWICIDDNSSQKDRDEMKKLFPFFKFILKDQNNKGHAKSLNIMLQEVKTEYVFMFEDDWVCHSPFKVLPYIQFLESNPFDQIRLYNFLEVQQYKMVDSHENINKINDIPVYKYIYNPNCYRKTAPGVVQSFKDLYSKFEKEFGIYGSGKSSRRGNTQKGDHYPGFSLNPSIFNINSIKQYKLTFNEESEYNDSFELYFAFKCHDVGIRIAQTHINISHIGDYNSAYVLNDKARPHDIGDNNYK